MYARPISAMAAGFFVEIHRRLPMEPNVLFERYRELQQYVGWTPADADLVREAAPAMLPSLPALVEDFYAEIERHPQAAKVITGGAAQVDRLKGTLTNWLRELLSGRYDADYVARRWRVGCRHVEIGLDQVYTNVALSRLRSGLHRSLRESWSGERAELVGALHSLDKLLDLDLAIIEDAYQAEYLRRQQQAERLATIGQVAGGIAHELRNPLNVIKTSVYYLLNARSPAPEKRAEHLARIEKQVGLADGVITALSNFARLPLPNLQPFSVESWIRDTVESSNLPESIQVALDFPPELPPALGDSDQMRIVFGNLVRNAREAMPDGGRLAIAARADGGYIDIVVADSGTGIHAEHLSRIMEPLFSTKARGIGLGLAMARAIVEKSNGRLTVDSRPGQGATFTVRLPAAPQKS
jgi:signal transduction histidine kinase